MFSATCIIFLSTISRNYEKLGYKKGLCPNAEKLYDEMLTIPLYYAMSDQDVDDVIAAVTKIARYYAV